MHRIPGGDPPLKKTPQRTSIVDTQLKDPATSNDATHNMEQISAVDPPLEKTEQRTNNIPPNESAKNDDACLSRPLHPPQHSDNDIDTFNEHCLLEDEFPNSKSALPNVHRPMSSVSSDPATRRVSARPTNENPNFVRDYFSSSRLHFIGSFRARYEAMMVSVAEKLNVSPGELLFVPAPLPAPNRIIVHIDMDCFFASVAMATNPSLVGKPIAVCHTKGDGIGGGEISSCSYEARACGVKAGMFFPTGQKLVAQHSQGRLALIGVPYDFAAYERASIAMYARFYSVFGARIEALSVDEAYLDVTHAAEKNVDELVSRLRKGILADTGCNASAGIGPNKLVARLATKLAKPNGQKNIGTEGIVDLISKLSVGDIPGVGWRTRKRFSEMNIDTCGQLQAVPLSTLQSEFGEKQGRIFYDTVRGIDERPVEPMKPRKSIGAEASWGVRFTSSPENAVKCEKFIADMAAEVTSRVLAAGALGSKVLYKVYQSKKIAGKMKYLGHGPCNILTRSARIMERVDKDNLKELLAKTCLKIHKDIGVKNEELRGVGIQLTDLVFENLKLVPDGEKATSKIDVFLKGGAKKNLFEQQSLSGAQMVLNVKKRPRSGLKDFFVKKSRLKTDDNEIPDDWDQGVFEALPMEIRKELIANHRRTNANAGPNRSAVVASTSTPVRRRTDTERRNGTVVGSPMRNRGIQTTMTQFARAREPVVEPEDESRGDEVPESVVWATSNASQKEDGDDDDPLLFENELNGKASQGEPSCQISRSSGSEGDFCEVQNNFTK